MRNPVLVWAACWAFVLLAWPSPSAGAASTNELLEAIKKVDRAGQGNIAAGKALRELTRQDADVLLEILKAFEGSSPLAINWLRGGFETIADRQIKQNRSLPTEDLEAFIKNGKQDANARRLAFEWLQKVDSEAAGRLIPGFLHDPSAELRREAVAQLIEEAKAIDAQKMPDAAIAIYRKALSGAVDADQVKKIVEPLKRLKIEVDLPRHFGFVTDWQIIGPFDHREGIGFNADYPPENEIDLDAVYDTKYDAGFEGGKVRWQPFQTKHDYGMVDIGKDIKNYKGACMYAVATFHSDKDQPVQIRLGTPNAWKLWVNGELLFAREEYHRGARMDQYRVAANLKAGENLILLKICQNEQPDDWAQRYQFQLRISNAAGSAILPVK